MFKRMLRDKKGLSLIELICAVAILSIIAATVGGAMVVATNSYRQGSVETSLQQESQFTANAIEALIVDATDKVEFDGTSLTVKNTDYTYVISYNPGAKELRYTQTGTTTGDVVASNELLAQHVEDFFADTSDFESNRTVRLSLKLKNEKSEFTTTYNITSRNNPNAGDPVTVTASILCLDEILLEPNQTYTLNVDVVGPANKNFSCYLEPEPDGTTFASAVVNGGGIDITIQNSEDGGDDGMLRLWIQTSASDASGTPLKKKVVNIHIRRINKMNINESSVTGTRSKKDCVYSLTHPASAYIGTNLDRTSYVTDMADYVNPRTVVWSFESSSGSAAEYFDVNGTGGVPTPNDAQLREEAINFKLKKDVPPGVTLTVKASSLHSMGIDRGANMNKTGLPYNKTVFATYEIKTEEDSDLMRGSEYWDLPLDTVNPYEWAPDCNTIHQRFLLFRFISDDGTSKSQGYPAWRSFSDQGTTFPKVQMTAGDFNGMDYMKGYTIQLCYTFRYSTYDNQQKYYPEGSDNWNTFHPGLTCDADYMFEFHLAPMNVVFDRLTVDGTAYNISGYLSGDKNGLGTKDNPLPLRKGSNVYLYATVKGAVANQGAINDLGNNASKYKYNGSGFSNSGIEFQYMGGNKDTRECWFRIGTQNGVENGGIYKIMLNRFNGQGTEYYCANPDPNYTGAAKGLIYFKIYE